MTFYKFNGRGVINFNKSNTVYELTDISHNNLKTVVISAPAISDEIINGIPLGIKQWTVMLSLFVEYEIGYFQR